MLNKTFVRHSSHYLSAKWSKEPFSIGYFPSEVSRVTDDKKRYWEEVFGQASAHHQVSPPVPTRGIDLFKAVSGLSYQPSVKRHWDRLSPEKRHSLENPPAWVYEHQLRVWQGYEVVEHLKRHSAQYRWNPYVLTDLYPWEIVKDKLRRTTEVYEFEQDYYDILIREAFGRNSKRKPQHIFYTDLHHENPDIKFTWNQVQQRFQALDPVTRQYYTEKGHRRHEQALLSRAPYNKLAFHDFVASVAATENRPLLAAARQWNEMDPRKRPSRTDRSYTNTRQYKDRLLNVKVAIVMDYIFYTGGAVGMPKSYNWIHDMNSMPGVYLDKIYWVEVL